MKRKTLLLKCMALSAVMIIGFSSCNDDEKSLADISTVLSIESKELTFAASEADPESVIVTVNGIVEWTVGSTDVWIKAYKISDAQIGIQVSDNNLNNGRTGSIIVTATNFGGKITLPVSQSANEYIPPKISLDDLQGEYDVFCEIAEKSSNISPYPGVTEWRTSFELKEDDYGSYIYSTQWAGEEYGFFIELSKDGNHILLDTRNPVAGDEANQISAFIVCACMYINPDSGISSIIFLNSKIDEYGKGEWDEETQTLTFSPGTYVYEGIECEVFFYCGGFSNIDGGYVKAYTAAYKKMIFQKSSR